ncbi:MAG TPA: UrcA family protein [Allosphingosinicella sp.]|nr:UrcA family protein [Allosphingosinicella sp.]
MKTFATIAAAAVAALAFAAPAAARDQVAAQEVDIHDLDRQQDADEIERRIAQAARRVCGSGGSRTLTAYIHVRTCRAEAIERARAR